MATPVLLNIGTFNLIYTIPCTFPPYLGHKNVLNAVGAFAIILKFMTY